MNVISENEIESVLKTLESEETSIADLFKQFDQEQPAFIQFIALENFKILKEKEYDLLVFILVVIYRSFELEKGSLSHQINAELLEKIDEKNWEIYNEEGSQNYGKALDIYFKDYPQEDLLAFVEDTLVEDDDNASTAVGKEIIFITAKNLIDCLHHKK